MLFKVLVIINSKRYHGSVVPHGRYGIYAPQSMAASQKVFCQYSVGSVESFWILKGGGSIVNGDLSQINNLHQIYIHHSIVCHQMPRTKYNRWKDIKEYKTKCKL